MSILVAPGPPRGCPTGIARGTAVCSEPTSRLAGAGAGKVSARANVRFQFLLIGIDSGRISTALAQAAPPTQARATSDKRRTTINVFDKRMAGCSLVPTCMGDQAP